MIRWFWQAGEGHVIVDTDVNEQGAAAYAACDAVLELSPDDGNDIREAQVYTERPFAGDSCRTCHNAVKRWAADPSEAPEYTRVAPPAPAGPKRMTAAERRAAIAGAPAPEPVSMPEDGAPAPAAPAPVQSAPAPEPGSDEDLGLEPVAAGGGPAVVGGATFVVPTRRRGSSRREAADIEIDSD